MNHERRRGNDFESGEFWQKLYLQYDILGL